MRRKSTRNASKASPEKAVESTSTRRSRRHSKRRKRSSSRSSSEGSDDVNLKTVAQQMSEVPAEEVASINLPGEDPEPVWKVKPSAAPSGEIQKIKICLTRPAPASPEKVEPSGRRLRNKSGSQAEEDVVSPEEKMPRKSKRRSSPGLNVEDVEEQTEETEDKKGKGKSKTKHKSKSEKTPKSQDLQDQTQSEISENVQVTPQSPQAAIDIRVDNESVSPIEHETVDTNETETNSAHHKVNTSENCEVTSEIRDKTISEEIPTETVSDVVSQPETSSSPKPQDEASDSHPDVDFKESKAPEQNVDNQNEQVQDVAEAPVFQQVTDSEKTEEKVVEPQESIANKNTETVVEEIEITADKNTETVVEQIETMANKNAETVVEQMETTENKNTETVVEQIETTANKNTETVVEQIETTANKNTETVVEQIETTANKNTEIVVEETVQGSSSTQEVYLKSPAEAEVVVKNKTTEDEEAKDESISSEKPELVVQSEEEKKAEKPEDSQEPATPVSINVEKMDTEESVAQPGTEEVEVAKETEKKDVTNESEHQGGGDSCTSEVISEPMQVEEAPRTPIHHESKDERSTSEEPESTEQKEETDEQEVTPSSPIHNKDESSTRSVPTEEPQRLDEDSRSVDVIIMDNSCTPKKEDSSSVLNPSFSPEVREIVEANKKLQNMKDEIRELFPTPPATKRRRKWGNSLVGFDLLTPTLKKIDMDSIKELCPDLQLLQENELKMEIREIKDRRKSEQSERKSDRKVSIDHQSNDDDHKKLQTQDSVNSSEMEEANEPEVDNSNIIAMNRKISIVDDTASKMKPPPSPAKNPVSEVLYITNLVRPFTLKQLKELLERTGKIKENGFWTDRIKSKCYVYYETIEEAEATRNALHGVHWPIGNGKKLMIDYATPEDLEKARNPEPTPPVVPEEKVPEKENQVLPVKKHKPEEPEKVVKERESHRSEAHVREWDIGKEELNKLRSRSRERESRNERNDRRKHRRSPSPGEDFISRKQRKKEEDVPQKLMDDLFRKTKTTPSIYWLPLTPEEIATKQQQRLLRMAEHKRRMEESSRSRGDYGRGAPPYRRRYD